jgi:general secretion pathway protein N
MKARQVLLYGIAAVVGVAGASAIYAPASVAAWLVARGTSEEVTIGEPTGTLWTGAGNVLVRSPQGALSIPGFSWDIELGYLWRGEIAARVRADGPQIAGAAEVGRGPHSVWLRNAEVHAPLELLSGGLAALQPLGPSGRLTLRATSLGVNAPAVTGAADLLLENAQSVRYGSLGDYRVAVQGAPDGALLNVSTLKGPLHIQGNGEMSVDGALRFRGQASVDEADRARFNPVISFIGVPRPDGSVPLEWPLSGAGELPVAPVMSAN